MFGHVESECASTIGNHARSWSWKLLTHAYCRKKPLHFGPQHGSNTQNQPANFLTCSPIFQNIWNQQNPTKVNCPKTASYHTIHFSKCMDSFPPLGLCMWFTVCNINSTAHCWRRHTQGSQGTCIRPRRPWLLGLWIPSHLRTLKKKNGK